LNVASVSVTGSPLVDAAVLAAVLAAAEVAAPEAAPADVLAEPVLLPPHPVAKSATPATPVVRLTHDLLILSTVSSLRLARRPRHVVILATGFRGLGSVRCADCLVREGQ
jgi:hypothetical protein